MTPTDHLIRISDGTVCSAWGGDYFNGVYYYNLLSHYEDSRHFRHMTNKDNRDYEDGKIKYMSGSETLKILGENLTGVITREEANKFRDSNNNSWFNRKCLK